jgi:hypothetical protein
MKVYIKQSNICRNIWLFISTIKILKVLPRNLVTMIPMFLLVTLTGSYENEVLAVDFIRKQLTSIQQRAKPIHKITIDLQVSMSYKSLMLRTNKLECLSPTSPFHQ